MIRILVEGPGGGEYRTFRAPTVTIGRSRKCDLSFPGARGVSRFHCRLTLANDRCLLEDLGSRNLSLVNGRPLQQGPIRPGDRLTLGSVRLRLDALGQAETTEELVQPCLHCGHIFSRRNPECPRCGTAVRQSGRSRAIGEFTFTGFRLVRKLGSGGMGIVFEAEELGRRDNRRVALKVLRPHLACNAAYLAQFIEEIRVLTSLRHPSIVTVYGRGKEEDLHYVTMELVNGLSAREAMAARGRLPWQTAVHIAWEAAKALNVAHQQAGIVHGDVKPGNFLLDQASRVKLCDFGLARVDLKRLRPSRDQAVEAERRGTAAFAAPERFADGGLPTVASDVYSLGVSLFQMVTGHLPFRGGSVASLREQHMTGDIPRVRDHLGDVGPGVQLLLERMLAKDPKDRYRDYPTLIEDLGLLVA